jgi:hypothetical protein
MKETLWKNNLNFVKDVYLLYVHFIKILIIVSEGKNARHYFRTAPRISLRCQLFGLYSVDDKYIQILAY